MTTPATPEPSDSAANSEQDDDLEPVMVTLTFQASNVEALLAVLSKYVVLSRMDPAARNIDLVASMTKPGRFTIVEKWESVEAQQAHFDSDTMVERAQQCDGLLAEPPDIDLHEAVTMHDLG